MYMQVTVCATPMNFPVTDGTKKKVKGEREQL